MSQEEELRFTQHVTRQLPSEEEAVRSLWLRLAEVFDKDGPEDAGAYLEAQRQQLQDRVQNLLNDFEEV